MDKEPKFQFRNIFFERTESRSGWRLSLISAAVAAVCLTIDLLTPHGLGNVILYQVVLFFTIFYARRRMIIFWAAIISALLVIGFLFSPSGSGSTLKDAINRCIVLIFVWIVSYIGHAYKKHQESISRMASIMESSSDALIATDLSGHIQQYNRSAILLYRWGNESKLNMVYRTVFENEDEARRVYETVKGGRIVRAWEMRHRNHQDKIFDVSLSAWPITDFTNKVVGVSMIVRDVSWRKERERDRQEQLALLEHEVDKRTRQLREKNTRLKRLSQHINTVREQERQTMAREIHDELGQWLTALKMDISLTQRYLGKDMDKAESKLQDMTTVVDSTIASVQRLVSQLRPTVLDELGLGSALQWYFQEFKKRYDLSYAEDIALTHELFNEDVAMALYRVFQECLTNVARHAQASRVDVSFKKMDDQWVLTVEDDGVGLDQNKLQDSRSFGLIGMQERLEFCGGQVEFISSLNKGTKVSVCIPLEVAYGKNSYSG